MYLILKIILYVTGNDLEVLICIGWKRRRTTRIGVLLDEWLKIRLLTDISLKDRNKKGFIRYNY